MQQADYVAGVVIASIQDLERSLSGFRAFVRARGIHVGVNGVCATCSEPWPCGQDRLAALDDEAAHCARALLDVMGLPAYKGYASDFRRRLVELAVKCDGHNRDKLRVGFPVVVEVLELWERDPEAVDAMARSDGRGRAGTYEAGGEG